jgi:hypothetical protein
MSTKTKPFKIRRKTVFKFKTLNSHSGKLPSGSQHPTTTVSGTFPTTMSAVCKAN